MTDKKLQERADEIANVLRERVVNRSYAYLMVGVRPGWAELVEDLHNTLVKINPKYSVQQVKEKFGTLRFYASMVPNEDPSTDPKNFISQEDSTKFFRTIHDAEAKSATICDTCGKPGNTLTIGTMLATVCPFHAAELNRLSQESGPKTPDEE